MSTNYINDVKKILFNKFHTNYASLIAYQGKKQIPFDISRVFVIKANDTVDRGAHAHIECWQLLVALSENCFVTCDDSRDKITYLLNSPDEGLLIPPGIWATQKYTCNTILMVFASLPFDEKDYIRDYKKFISYKEML